TSVSVISRPTSSQTPAPISTRSGISPRYRRWSLDLHASSTATSPANSYGHKTMPEDIARQAERPVGIRLTGIEQRYKTRDIDVLALTNVNLDIAKGEFLVLLGPSGCGKTTLLRIIAGLLKSTSGTVEVGGQALWNGRERNDAVMQELGVVF